VEGGKVKGSGFRVQGSGFRVEGERMNSRSRPSDMDGSFRPIRDSRCNVRQAFARSVMLQPTVTGSRTQHRGTRTRTRCESSPTVAVRWINRGSNVVDRPRIPIQSVIVEARFTHSCPIEYEYECEYEYRFTEYEYDLPDALAARRSRLSTH
jgi:hypothetical protein